MAGINRAINAGSTFCGAQALLYSTAVVDRRSGSIRSRPAGGVR